MTQLLAIFCGFIIVLGFATGWTFNLAQIGQPDTSPDPDLTPNATPFIPDSQIRAASAKWNIRDALTKIATAAGDTGYVGVVKGDANGYFNFLVPVEETEFDAAPDVSSGIYSTGDDIILAISSDNDPTGGYETYPRWFYIENLDHGSKIYAFPLKDPKSALMEYESAGKYTYKVNKAAMTDTGQSVTWLQGDTNYWIFGDYFELYGRVAKDYLIEQVTNKGVVGATLNDGATWEDTHAEINANFTFTSDQEDIFVELVGEAADVSFGLPTLAVTASGQVKQYNGVLVFATNATGLDPQPLLDDGWVQISKPDMTSDIAFYYELKPETDGCIPGTGDVLSVKIPLTISDSGLAASTLYDYQVWVLDWQHSTYVASGTTTTSLPSYNGFITEVGSDSVVEPLALTISNGAVATPQLFGYFTTNA